MDNNIGLSIAQDFLKKAVKLQNFRSLQFAAQFLFFSKYGEESHVFQQFLVATEMIKFILKLIQYFRSYSDKRNPSNIFMQKYVVPSENSQMSEEPLKGTQLQKIKTMLKRLKEASWTKNDFQSQMFQRLPNGKRIQLITSSRIPKDLQRKRFTFWQVIGELLLILRPLASIIAIRIFGQESYIHYFLSLGIELAVLFLQRKATLLTPTEAAQWQSRKKDMIWRCIFKRPVFELFKNKLVRPCLGTIMAQHRLVYKAIMYIIDIQSSITLTI